MPALSHRGLRVPHTPPCPSQPRCCVGTERWVDRVGAALHAWPKMLAPEAQRSPGLRQLQRLPPPPPTPVWLWCSSLQSVSPSCGGGGGFPVLQNCRGNVSVRPHGGG